ncbi:hypothetical protein EH223_00130 [candidate division KSB1 bacterium]|nr:hypothetical protein [candidate division KSB1 bacterium]RQW07332.1 MAG: hypothetical protein EH223_00130 [candidate division KSB1 bacterium]
MFTLEKSHIIKTLWRIAFVVCFAIFIVCSTPEPQQPAEKILVEIGDKATISLNEFIRRAEYTPRPDYCRMNTYLHKKIILNSLIAEKLLAIEAGENHPLLQDGEFQLFLSGRKEQAMRQWMHHVEATEKVALDSTDIKRAYKLAGREYEIEYFTTSDTSFVNYYKNRLPAEPDLFNEAFFQLAGDSLPPERTVKWIDKEHANIHSALFGREFQIGQVLDPVQVENDYVFIKIKGWHDEVAFTPKQQQERRKNVTEKLTSLQASTIWNARVADIMRGKRLDFNQDVFRKLSDLFFEVYFHTDRERRDQIIEKVWDVELEDAKSAIDNLSEEGFMQQTFFTVDDIPWTVADFRKAIVRHPLVFRERKMPSNEFPAQFRLAIADLVRDHYVTEEAYKKGYDQVNIVQRNVRMWQDFYLALVQRQNYLQTVGEKRPFLQNYHAILEETLNPYVRELQQKYYKQIKLDFQAFEDISLASIDLFVKQPEMPFKYVVPMFPIVTSEHLIDYVTRME